MNCKKCGKEFSAEPRPSTDLCESCRAEQPTHAPKVDPAMKLQGTWRLPEVLTKLDALASRDLAKESTLSLLRKLMIALGVGSFISIFVSAALESFLPIMFCGAALIGAIFLYCLKKRSDMGNEFRQFLAPLLKHLKEDIKKDSEVQVDVLLNRIDEKCFLKSKKSYSVPRYTCKAELFSRDLLNFSVRLHDGNALSLHVAESLMSIRKTRTVGKAKVKYEYKLRSRADLGLTVNNDKYEVLQPAVKEEVQQKNGCTIVAEGIRAEAGKKGMILSARYRVKHPEVSTFDGIPMPDPLHAIDRLIALYACLKPKAATEGGK